MPSIKTQDLYRVVITEAAGIAASWDVDFTVSVAPTRTNGFLVLSPENATSREVVYFHNVIGNRIYVRWVNRRSPKLHPVNDSVQMNDVEDIFNYYSDMVSPLFYMEKTGALNVRIWGGTILVNRSQVTVADTNLTLTDNATNYIVYDYLTNVVSVNTTGVGLVKVTVTVTSGVIGTPTYNVIKESYADPYVPDLALVAPEVQKQTWVYATATGAVNTYAITLTPAITSYQAGQKFTFKANLANTGTATLNVNGLGAKTIKKLGGTTNLASGDIAINQMVEVEYNGTDFDMQSPVASVFQLDIHGQTQKTDPKWADELIISDSEASFINKRVTIDSIRWDGAMFGDGSDWDLTISSWTTTIAFSANWYVEKQYNNLTITWWTLTFSGPATNGSVAVLKVKGRFKMTGGTISVVWMGAAGQTLWFTILRWNWPWAGWAGSTWTAWTSYQDAGWTTIFNGAGGWNSPSAFGGSPWRWGGILIIEADEWEFTTGALDASGQAATTGNAPSQNQGCAGSGGGWAWTIVRRARIIISDTGTYLVNGWNWANWLVWPNGNPGNNDKWGGGGGSNSAGWVGGATPANGANSTWWTWWTKGTDQQDASLNKATGWGGGWAGRIIKN